MRRQITDNEVFKSILEVARQIKPKDGKIILFGSQARGEATSESDWDILILLNKKQIKSIDRDKYSFPFWELGWQLDAMIHPLIYTMDEWNKRAHSAFLHNVETDGIELC
ncbi:nucleotidyltransferase domain-containing protein [Prevotella sp. HUN102]|uniref:nucleotidyltransferase domain-containing protein n=1 Tax=Prevotella sp. HUN102 TaxID=1392486 RepID=UPI00048C9C3E|nr:nucleotidyltransferase domain-containing protein [Prevotella sp. HUN102]